MITIAVLSAGMREPSSTKLLAERLGDATLTALGERGIAARTDLIELRHLARPIADAMVTGQVSDELSEAFGTITEADALIAVSPAFNGSYSGLFKSFLDVLPDGAVRDMPVLLGATGGTPRHALMLEHAMRPLFSYLRAITVPTGVYAATEDFGGVTGAGVAPAEALGRRVERAGADLGRMITALGSHERHDVEADELDAMTRLLAGLAA